MCNWLQPGATIYTAFLLVRDIFAPNSVANHIKGVVSDILRYAYIVWFPQTA